MAEPEPSDAEIDILSEPLSPKEAQDLSSNRSRQKETDFDPAKDRELLRAYTRGDERAFEGLVEKYFRMVYTLAARQTGDAYLAEEVAQTVFILLSRKAQKFSSRSSVAGWLLRTAHFVGRDALKKRRRREEHARELALTLDPQIETRPQPSARELLLEDALRTLLPHEQEAILARFLERKNFREIAAMFDITELTARKRTSRALAKLQRFMFKHGASVSQHTLGSLLGLPSPHSAPPQALPSLLRTLHAVWKGQAAGAKAAALADHALRLLRWRLVAAASLKIAVCAMIPAAAVWSIGTLNRPVPTRLEKLGRAWAELDRQVAQHRLFLRTTPYTAPNYQARLQQELGAIGQQSARVISELKPLLAPPGKRHHLAMFFAAELSETLKLSPAQRAVLLSYVETRLAQGATLQDGMKILAQTTTSETAEIKATLSPEQRQLFDQIYGADGVLLFSYAKAVALGTIGL